MAMAIALAAREAVAGSVGREGGAGVGELAGIAGEADVHSSQRWSGTRVRVVHKRTMSVRDDRGYRQVWRRVTDATASLRAG